MGLSFTVEVAILSLHSYNRLVYINTLMLQEVLAEAIWRERMGEAERWALTPLFYTHVNPYRKFSLDMTKRLTLAALAI